MLTEAKTMTVQAAPLAGLAPGDGRRLLEACATGILVVAEGRVAYANPVAAEMHGHEPGQLVGQPLTALVAPSMRARVQGMLEGRLPPLAALGERLRGQRLNGSEFDIWVTARPVQFSGHKALLLALGDVSPLLQAAQRADSNAALLAQTEALCRSGSFRVLLPDGKVQPSPGMRALAGLPEGDELFSIDSLPWVPPDEQAYVAGIWRSAEPGEPFEFQHRLMVADGERLIVLHRGRVQTNTTGQRIGVAVLQDITVQRAAEERAQELATHDEVTGLANRAALMEKLEADMLAAGWEAKSVALLAIEVPRVGEIKTKMGFGAGDTLAMALAARLSSSCGPGEFVAQVGDGEFVLTVEGPQEVDMDAVVARARAVQELLHAPVPLGATPVFPLSVIGLASFPGDGDTPDALLEAAQTARLGATVEASIAQCAPDSNARAVREMAVEAALRQALKGDELTLHYQPQVDLANGQIVGAEALLRWHSPTLGQVSPAEFVPVAEQSGLIGAIGDWVIEHACEQIVAWRKAGLAAVRVCVNLSPMQLQRPNLAAWIQSVLLRTGAPADALGVEITESTAMSDVTQARQTLKRLRALGVEVALDDFGTGYSSLSSLRMLPVDVVKIDRSFVHDVTASPEDMSVTKSIIGMVHGLHMRVLAEGVETEGQLGPLASHGCDLIQGYLFSAALAADDFAAMLRERKRLPERFLTQVRRTRTLLLVDDESNILSALKRLLRRDGYTILSANSGEEALKLLGEHEADVIVSDQRMPGMNGTEFLQRAHELYPHTVRMVLSGYTDLQSVIDAVNDGAIYRFLTKPWDDDKLREQIAEAFRRKALDDENRRLSTQLETANASYAELNAQLERMVEQQREQAEVFARSADNLREMLDALPLPVFGVDADDVLVFGNREAQPLLEADARANGMALGLPAPPQMRGPARPDEPGAWVQLAGRRFQVLRRPVPGLDATGGSLLMLMPAATAEGARP